MLLFLFRGVFKNFYTIPVVIENLNLALAILIGAPITVANDAIKMVSLVAYKAIVDLSK